MEVSDYVSLLAVIIAGSALLVSIKALRNADRNRVNDRFQELRIIVSDTLNEMNIISIRMSGLEKSNKTTKLEETMELLQEVISRTNNLHNIMFGTPIGFDEKSVNDLSIKAKILRDMLSQVKARLDSIDENS